MGSLGFNSSSGKLSNFQRNVFRVFFETFPAYGGRECDTNIKRLSLELRDKIGQQKKFLENTKILIIYPSERQNIFFGRRRLPQCHTSDSENLSPWSFHAILDIDGMIFDYDYTGFPGVGIKKYIGDMFGESAQDLQVLYCGVSFYLPEWQREIPAICYEPVLPSGVFRQALNQYAEQSVAKEDLTFNVAALDKTLFSGIPKPEFAPSWWPD